jgi:hypothetical protein
VSGGAEVADALPDTVVIDGIERPTRNSEGQPIHDTVEGIRNFWAWFGDSKAVDGDGRPVVIYHGTDASIKSFEPSTSGTLGQGIYFANNEASARAYGDNVVAANVSLQSPWVVALDSDSEGAIKEDFDSPCVEAVLGLPGGRKMLDAARYGTGMYDYRLQRVLMEAGHDGIIGTYPDGSREYVAFRPEQIKSATGNSGRFDPSSASLTDAKDVPAPAPKAKPRGPSL